MACEKKPHPTRPYFRFLFTILFCGVLVYALLTAGFLMMSLTWLTMLIGLLTVGWMAQAAEKEAEKEAAADKDDWRNTEVEG